MKNAKEERRESAERAVWTELGAFGEKRPVSGRQIVHGIIYWRAMVAFSLLIVLVALGGLVWALAVALIALGILCPPRMNDGKAMYWLRRLSPGDLGMEFENQNFTVRDVHSGRAMQIGGWWIGHPGKSDRCIVLIHGYADAKVGAIAWAPMLQKLGWNILAIDLRAHGESGGRFSTAGYFERHDVSQVIDELLASRPDETRKIALFGISLGAAVGASVASSRDDLCAVILESPFTDFRRATLAHFAMRGVPARGLVLPALRLAAIISGAQSDDVRPVDLIRKIRCRVLAIVGGADDLVDADDLAALKESLGEHRLSVFADVPHLMAMLVDPEGYERCVGEFLGSVT